ncbi:MAG: protein kinase family protein [Phycisphaerales bacterium]|nr:protein kinase family protein [Phycisphaerales bacterium]
MNTASALRAAQSINSPLAGEPAIARREPIGSYDIVRVLPAGVSSQRVLTRSRTDGSAVVAHAIRRSLTNAQGWRAATGRPSRDGKRLLGLLAPLRTIENAHILPISDVVLDGAGWHWVVTPYCGAADGLVTLANVVSAQPEGRLSAVEALHATRQLLLASEAAHVRGVVHGALDPEEVLVDRHGSIAIELYGLRRRMSGAGLWDANAAAHEVRSIAALSYRMVTGFAAPDHFVRASRVVRGLGERFDDWLALALDGPGFASVGDALSSLPGVGGAARR